MQSCLLGLVVCVSTQISFDPKTRGPVPSNELRGLASALCFFLFWCASSCMLSMLRHVDLADGDPWPGIDLSSNFQRGKALKIALCSILAPLFNHKAQPKQVASCNCTQIFASSAKRDGSVWLAVICSLLSARPLSRLFAQKVGTTNCWPCSAELRQVTCFDTPRCQTQN